MPDLLTMSPLVFRQRAKLIELTNEFHVKDDSGNDVGLIRQEGQGFLRKALRLVSNFDEMLPHTLAVYENDGQKVLELRKGFTLWRGAVQVWDASGALQGSIQQANLIGKARLELTGANGESLGGIQGESWFNWDFVITDAKGAQVGRLSKKWAGFGREIFTTADHYVLEIDPGVSGPLRALLVATAAGVDLLLKQSEG